MQAFKAARAYTIRIVEASVGALAASVDWNSEPRKFHEYAASGATRIEGPQVSEQPECGNRC